MLNIKTFKAEIIELKEYEDNVEGEHVLVKTFKLELPEKISFKAGQFAMLSHDDFKRWDDPDKLKEAAFSICSSPFQKKVLEFCIRVHDSPGLTNFIGTRLGIGDKLNVKAPFGVFTINPDFNENVFISSGTGIAPMISFVRDHRDKNDPRKIRFFYGFWNTKVFPFREEIRELEKKSWFEFNGIISSREDKQWNGEKGFVQDLLEKHDFSYSKEKIHAYVCGNPKMMNAVLSLLPRIGFKKENIHREQW